MEPDLSNVTLAVLAGGAGSRMGKPKGLLEVRGRPILAYLLERFRWPGPTLLVTAPGRERPPGWDLFDRETADPVSGEGPLRGVLTALDHAATRLVAVTTVDMPGIGAEHLGWISEELRRAPDALAVMVRHGGRVEPFPAVFRVDADADADAAGRVRTRLDAGLLSVQSLAGEEGFIVVPTSPAWREDMWTNLNRPEDLERWLAESTV